MVAYFLLLLYMQQVYGNYLHDTGVYQGLIQENIACAIECSCVQLMKVVLYNQEKR